MLLKEIVSVFFLGTCFGFVVFVSFDIWLDRRVDKFVDSPGGGE